MAIPTDTKISLDERSFYAAEDIRGICRMGCNLKRSQALSAADIIEEQRREIESLRKIKKEWEQMVQPAFDYVGSCGIGRLGESKIQVLIDSRKAQSDYIKLMRKTVTDKISDR